MSVIKTSLSSPSPYQYTSPKSDLLKSSIIFEEIEEIKSLISQFSDPCIPEEIADKFKQELDEILSTAQSESNLTSVIQKTALENLFLDSQALLSNSDFLDVILTILERLISKSRITFVKVNSKSGFSNQADSSLKCDLSLNKSSQDYYSINNLNKEEIDTYLTEIFAKDTSINVLKKFVISFDTQNIFYENYNDFDYFDAKLNLLNYLGIKYSKLYSNPKSSFKWYSNFITSEKYTSIDNMGFDKKKGKGDHGTYYFKSINLNGESKIFYFKNRDQNTVKKVQIENIYNQIINGLREYTNLNIDFDDCTQETKTNYFIFFNDLNNVLDSLILKLLKAPRIKKLYNPN